jgi:uncharacterized membrane protein YphA (DoxX/SURF4 family)
MSNRNKWAHWKNPKPDKHWRLKQWSLGIALIALGSLLLLSGFTGLQEHVLWFQTFSFRFGKPVIALTVSLLVIGGVFVLAGIMLLVLPEH